MLSLDPRMQVATATALASWRQQISEAPEQDRVSSDPGRAAASLHFVRFLGFWSQFAYQNGRSAWPLPRCKAVEELTDFAEQHGVLETWPLPLDVLLLASVNDKRHVRAGILVDVESALTLLDQSGEFVCSTIEGDVSDQAGESDPRATGEPRNVRVRGTAECGMTRDAAPETAPYTLVIEDRCAPEILERVIREAQPFLEREPRLGDDAGTARGWERLQKRIELHQRGIHTPTVEEKRANRRHCRMIVSAFIIIAIAVWLAAWMWR